MGVGLLFPHAAQAIVVTRRTRKIGSRRWRTETLYALASLTPAQAGPAQLATWLGGHWTVENRPALGPRRLLR